MRFSIVIPVYNAEKYLDTCLGSILHQQFSDCEILLVDDGSRDGSGEVCRKYAQACPDRIRYVFQENAGPSAARNRGIQMAAGEYLLFLDSDDALVADSLERIEKILLDKKPDAVIAPLLIRTETADSPEPAITDALWYDASADAVFEAMAHKRFAAPASKVIIRREIVTENGIRFPEEHKIGEDIFMMSQALCCCRSLVFDPVPHYVYHQNEGSIMHTVCYERISHTRMICQELFATAGRYAGARRNFLYTQMSMMMVNFVQYYPGFSREQKRETKQWLRKNRHMLKQIAQMHPVTALAGKLLGPGNAFLLAGYAVSRKAG